MKHLIPVGLALIAITALAETLVAPVIINGTFIPAMSGTGSITSVSCTGTNGVSCSSNGSTTTPVLTVGYTGQAVSAIPETITAGAVTFPLSSINPIDNVFTVSLTGNVTWAVSNCPVTGTVGSWIVIYTGTGAAAVVTDPVAVTYPGASQPTISTSNGVPTYIQYTTINNCTSIAGFGMNAQTNALTATTATNQSGGTVNAISAVISGPVTQTSTGIVKNTVTSSDNTTSSTAQIVVSASGGATNMPQLTLGAQAQARTTTRYGIPMGGYGEVLLGGTSPLGLMIGTGINTVPIIFGTSDSVSQIISSSGVQVTGTMSVAGASGVQVTTGSVTVGGSGTGAVGTLGLSGKMVVDVDNGNPYVVESALRRSENTTATLGAAAYCGRQRGTLASPVVVQNGDTLCTDYAYGFDSVDYAYATAITSTVNGTISNNVMPGKISFQTANAAGALTEAFNIDAAQRINAASGVSVNVGGTSTGYTDILVNPAAKSSGNLIDLQINGTSKFKVNNVGDIFASTLYVTGSNLSTTGDGIQTKFYNSAASGRAVNTGTTNIAIPAKLSTSYLSGISATGVTITLAAPSQDGEIRRIVFANASTGISWAFIAPATAQIGLPTTVTAGQAIAIVYNSQLSTPANSAATTWYQY
jgi:hypothetical protein